MSQTQIGQVKYGHAVGNPNFVIKAARGFRTITRKYHLRAIGTFYRSRRELLFVLKHGTAAHINTFELGQNGRYHANVWEYRGVNTRRAGRIAELALHSALKPVQMIADAIRDVSGRGDIVLDIFGGSCSTLTAALKKGCIAHLSELDPLNCDTILHPYKTFAHSNAEHLICGWTRASQAAFFQQGALH